MRYLSHALVALMLAVAVGACSPIDSDDPTPTPTATPSPEPTDTPASTLALIRGLDYAGIEARGRVLGAEDAPLRLEVFVDFRCPHCLEFTARIEPRLVEEYVRAGLVSLEIRDFPVLGPPSIGAAAAARCALVQDGYWPYHHALFEAQAEGVEIDVAVLIELADGTGLEPGRFETCLVEGETVPGVEADIEAAQGFGIMGTPGFVLDGEPLSGVPDSYETWQQLLDDRLP